MKPDLIIGAAGQVGEHLVGALRTRDRSIVQADLIPVSPEMVRLDISNPYDVQQIIKDSQPGIVYLAAALTNVDYCEEHPEEAFKVNVTGVQNVVEAANQAEARLVFFSSDYVFDGHDGPYSEEAAPHPICEYGRQKLLAEKIISGSSLNFLVIRTTVVYAWERQGKNFVIRLLKLLGEGREIRVPNDQIGSPTYAPNLAEAIIELTESNHQGIYHIAGPERTSRYEFACEAARVFGYPVELVRPVTTGEMDQPALRPLNAGMTSAKASAILKTVLIGYRAGLRLMKNAHRPPAQPQRKGGLE
jgi:dTDP-4-dehydrorhamnose reductase